MGEKSLLSSLVEKEKKREYWREWKRKNPEKVKEYTRNYYLRHRERRNEYAKQYREKHPEVVERMKERMKERYNTDPQFRRKCKESHKRWREKNKVRLRKLQPYTTGLECVCGFPIKCNTSGRFGKRLIKCPKCRFQTKMIHLNKVKIPRNIPVIPTNNPKTSKNHLNPNQTLISGEDNRKGV